MSLGLAVVSRITRDQDGTATFKLLWVLLILSPLEAQPPEKRETSRCIEPSSAAQTGQLFEADTAGGEITYQPVHPSF
jgi:hypothetical protein